ncbi:MAG: Uma2 family endonuclease [Salinibacter sp.]
MDLTAPSETDAYMLATRQRPLTVEEYHRMAEASILSEDDRVELLDGRLIAMSPIGPAHLHCVNRLNELLSRRLYATDDPPARLGVQNPIQLSDTSEPEPDVVLLRPGAPQDRTPTPADVLLVVEVAVTSEDYDRSVKTSRYATAGVPEYWLVDLEQEVVDVARDPDDDTSAEHIRHRRGDALPLPASIDADPIPVGDILADHTDGD